MKGSRNLSFAFVVGFPEEQFMDDPFRPFESSFFHCIRLRKDDSFKNGRCIPSMQARELTPQEVAEGRAGINDQKLTATQIQALVRKMDQSKTKWRRLRPKKAEYEQKLKEENSELYFNYPSLFNLHMEDRLDSTFFEMLTLKRKVEKGEVTPEQASTMVGQALYAKFVSHVVTDSPPPPPSMSYEEYYRQNQS